MGPPASPEDNVAAAASHDPYEFPCDDDEAVVAKAWADLPHVAGRQKQQRLPSRAGPAARHTSRQLFTSENDNPAALPFSLDTPINNLNISGSAGAGTGAPVKRLTGLMNRGSAAGAQSAAHQQGKKQQGILDFTVPMSLSGSSSRFTGQLPAGMVNHGNTCYLNAVLQDLTSSSLQHLNLARNSVTTALQTCLQQQQASSSGGGSSSCGAISPAVVSAAMARLSSRWGGCRQEDAHEFYTALIDAVQTEVLLSQHHSLGDAQHDKAIMAEPSADCAKPEPPAAVACPASRTFTGCLQHTLTCKSCGHVTSVKEQFNHLSLDLPDVTGRSSSFAVNAGCNSAGPSPASGQPGSGDGLLTLLGGSSSVQQQQLVPELQALLANFFAQETIEKDCEACGAVGAEHLQQHAVRRLPRVLVVHLKRFQWQVLDGSGAICRKLETQVKPDQELHLEHAVRGLAVGGAARTGGAAGGGGGRSRSRLSSMTCGQSHSTQQSLKFNQLGSGRTVVNSAATAAAAVKLASGLAGSNAADTSFIDEFAAVGLGGLVRSNSSTQVDLTAGQVRSEVASTMMLCKCDSGWGKAGQYKA
eukprot:gene5408-5641_t